MSSKNIEAGPACRPGRVLGTIAFLLLIAAVPAGHAKERSPVSAADVEALLAGRYDNAAQVAEGRKAGDDPPPQHVGIVIEPTPRPDWQLWRVHMDVDPDVAQTAGSDTSLDAVWALRIERDAKGASFALIPYTLKPAVDPATLAASSFDETRWLALEACALRGDFTASRVQARAPADEMCVAATMGLGGKRAFLPLAVERAGDWLHVQLTYFGKPWRVDARRSGPP